ncbi:hypothetical protein [Xylanimonas ulmi]|uniref:Uncharacterized protein n=1 Tax=Xylanimonas ulmi TaxID=228973 RepID=A0A4Q7M347_9MICO|nr:hypothetical protein [Xylanibacterium ulmi]RZS60349.1 hypothetical protein EV386_0604 [Xylanibacterium ulmi]
MSATVTAAERAERTARARRTATRAAARYAGTGHLIFAAAFWVLFGLVVVLVPVLIHAAGGQMRGGVTHAVGYSARWTAFSLAIGTTYNLAAPHLAAGGTRRTLCRGVVAGAVVAGLAYGLLAGAARLGERALFHSLGWGWQSPDGHSTAGSLGGDALAALSEGIAITGYALIGAGVVAAFLGLRRLGPAVLAILVALLTAAAVETLTRTGTGGQTLGRWVAQHALPAGAAGVTVSLLAALAVVALAAGWLWLRLRHVQLRPPA